MINFRYHIVSLTAVFLALLIGILMGTTVVSKATVDGLKANLHRAEARSAAVHQTNTQLSDELSRWTKTDDKVQSALTKNVLPTAVGGTLDEVPVLIIATEDADKDVLAEVTTALNDAGADLEGTLVVDDRMVLDASDADQLRKALDIPARNNVQAYVNRQLAIALAGAALPGVDLKGVPSTTTSTTSTTSSVAPTTAADQEPAGPTTTTLPPLTQPEIVDVLRANGQLGFRPAAAESSDAPVLESPAASRGTGYRYVVVSGTEASPVITRVLVPLVATMSQLGPVAQVAGSGPKDPRDPGGDPFLAPLLARDGVKGSVSTVDNLGSFEGTVATVFALVEAAEGRFGSYGIGDTATAVVPTVGRE